MGLLQSLLLSGCGYSSNWKGISFPKSFLTNFKLWAKYLSPTLSGKKSVPRSARDNDRPGRTDSGKSTFVRWLGGELCRCRVRVGWLDADIGQSTLGLPATMNLAPSDGFRERPTPWRQVFCWRDFAQECAL